MKHFYSSFALTAVAFVVAFFLGSWAGIYVCVLLALLEVSLSFDNAVINAKVLAQMPPVWQRRFITFGIPVAVFGMRLLFPLLIVSIASGASLAETTRLALRAPDEYHALLQSCEKQIFVFGGAFLLMVFFEWFFEHREVAWLRWFEGNSLVRTLRRSKNIALLCATISGLAVVWMTQSVSYAVCFFGAIALHALISLFSDIFSPGESVVCASNTRSSRSVRGAQRLMNLNASGDACAMGACANFCGADMCRVAKKLRLGVQMDEDEAAGVKLCGNFIAAQSVDGAANSNLAFLDNSQIRPNDENGVDSALNPAAANNAATNFAQNSAAAPNSNLPAAAARNGLAGFIYLEILDASFSFDGVIGAFALTGDILLIALGLGVGALFVRSLTIFLVEHGTLAKFRFLEHGAHYAIFFLGAVMLLKIHFHIGELVVGSVGFGFIAAAFLHSLWANKKGAENG